MKRYYFIFGLFCLTPKLYAPKPNSTCVLSAPCKDKFQLSYNELIRIIDVTTITKDDAITLSTDLEAYQIGLKDLNTQLNTVITSMIDVVKNSKSPRIESLSALLAVVKKLNPSSQVTRASSKDLTTIMSEATEIKNALLAIIADLQVVADDINEVSQ